MPSYLVSWLVARQVFSYCSPGPRVCLAGRNEKYRRTNEWHKVTEWEVAGVGPSLALYLGCQELVLHSFLSYDILFNLFPPFFSFHFISPYSSSCVSSEGRFHPLLCSTFTSTFQLTCQSPYPVPDTRPSTLGSANSLLLPTKSL